MLLRLGDAAFGFVYLLGERGGQRPLPLRRVGGEPVGRFLDRRLSLGPRLRHCPLKRSVGRLRLGFQLGGARQILLAPMPAGVYRGRHPRQPDPRHQDVEDDKRDREPEQLRRERLDIELRHPEQPFRERA